MKSFLLSNLKALPLRKNKEEVTLAKIIDPIIELAGFKTIDIESVEEEFDAKVGDSIFPIEVDRCLKNDGKPLVFIQCKHLGSGSLFKNDYEKTFKAARIKKISWVIFTNGEIWEFYKQNNSGYGKNKTFNLRYDQLQYLKVVNGLKNIKE